jgi:hypothetical protein
MFERIVYKKTKVRIQLHSNIRTKQITNSTYMKKQKLFTLYLLQALLLQNLTTYITADVFIRFRLYL